MHLRQHFEQCAGIGIIAGLELPASGMSSRAAHTADQPRVASKVTHHFLNQDLARML